MAETNKISNNFIFLYFKKKLNFAIVGPIIYGHVYCTYRASIKIIHECSIKLSKTCRGKSDNWPVAGKH